jgi:hypothetical protein
LVAALDGRLERRLFAAVLAVCDELRARLVVEADADVPAVHLLLFAVDAADPLMTGFCHVTADAYLLHESLRTITSN